MGPHWDPLWPRWLFPLHFFDSVRIGLFNQSPQPRQRLSTPIAWHLNYDVYLLGSRLVFHTHLFLLRLPRQLIILHVREPDLSKASARASRSIFPEYRRSRISRALRSLNQELTGAGEAIARSNRFPQSTPQADPAQASHAHPAPASKVLTEV